MIMEKFGFFDFQEGDDDTYRYNSDEFSTVIGAISGNGVDIKYGDKFAMSASGLTVTIGSGACWVAGHYGYNSTTTTLVLNPATNSGRKDYICAHLDRGNRCIEIIQVEGDAVSYPTLSEDYLPLYAVDVVGSSSTLTDSRTMNYGASNLPAAWVIYSAATPAVVEGGVWLKPVEG